MSAPIIYNGGLTQGMAIPDEWLQVHALLAARWARNGASNGPGQLWSRLAEVTR